MTTPHPYAEILRAITNGIPVQRQNSDGEWQNKRHEDTLGEISCASYEPARYRIAPRTITVNGIEVPEPVRTPLERGTTYFTPEPNRLNMYDFFEWVDSDHDLQRLARGIVHRTKANAATHGEAMIAPSKREST